MNRCWQNINIEQKINKKLYDATSQPNTASTTTITASGSGAYSNYNTVGTFQRNKWNMRFSAGMHTLDHLLYLWNYKRKMVDKLFLLCTHLISERMVEKKRKEEKMSEKEKERERESRRGGAKWTDESNAIYRRIQWSNMTINVHPFNILITLYQFLSIPCLLQCLWLLLHGVASVVFSFLFLLLLFVVCVCLLSQWRMNWNCIPIYLSLSQNIHLIFTAHIHVYM